jgi:hercynylcysteine S-oxide lyase
MMGPGAATGSPEPGPGTLAGQWGRWRWDRLPAKVVHLDTAAAGRCSTRTLRAMAVHAEQETLIGAYVAEAEAASVLAAGRTALASLLGMPADGLAFTGSASAAREILLAVWPLPSSGTIVVVPSEWGPNLSSFATRGLEITQLAVHDDGTLDLRHLERVLNVAPPTAVALTQVASHRGLLQPVRQAAELCRAAGVPLWVDAAQALGHSDTACGADVVYATGRKWLAGPRGTGVLAIARPWWDRLRVQAFTLARGSADDVSPVRLLEVREASIAGWVGLCAAVQQYLETGPASIWQRLTQVGMLTRQALNDLPGWEVVDPPEAGSAITALRPANGQDVSDTRARLLAEHGILTTAAAPARAPLEMTGPLLRISPHVDCTPEDLALLRGALAETG